MTTPRRRMPIPADTAVHDLRRKAHTYRVMAADARLDVRRADYSGDRGVRMADTLRAAAAAKYLDAISSDLEKDQAQTRTAMIASALRSLAQVTLDREAAALAQSDDPRTEFESQGLADATEAVGDVFDGMARRKRLAVDEVFQ